MQPLETIKQKLMQKPTIKDNEPVVIAIKIEGENIDPERQEKEQDRNATIIVDESNKEYDRKGLLKKLLDNKITKVQKKPVLEQVKEKEIIEPISPVINIPEQKKAKKIKQKKLILVGDNEIGAEKENIGEIQEIVFEKMEEAEPIAEMVPTEKKEPTRGRKTKKVEKGIAVLGPENAVEIGDTKISDRLLKKSPTVLVKVSS